MKVFMYVQNFKITQEEYFMIKTTIKRLFQAFGIFMVVMLVIGMIVPKSETSTTKASEYKEQLTKRELPTQIVSYKGKLYNEDPNEEHLKWTFIQFTVNGDEVLMGQTYESWSYIGSTASGYDVYYNINDFTYTVGGVQKTVKLEGTLYVNRETNSIIFSNKNVSDGSPKRTYSAVLEPRY